MRCVAPYGLDASYLKESCRESGSSRLGGAERRRAWAIRTQRRTPLVGIGRHGTPGALAERPATPGRPCVAAGKPPVTVDTAVVAEVPTVRARRPRRRVVTLLIVLSALVVVSVGLTMRVEHLQLEPVLSGSMRPVARPGDLVVAEKTRTTSLRVGDVVAFYPPGATGSPVMHRIVSLTRAGGTTTITTKGDANTRLDAWGQIRLASASTYRMVGTVPKLGFVSVWFNRSTVRTGRGLLLILAGLLVLAMGVLSLRRTRSATDGRTCDPSTESKGEN